MTYRLHRSQIVGGTLHEVFGFFKSPHNLEALTPPWLGFRVLEASDAEVRAGMRIAYRLRLHGIPVRWESRIAEYVENEMFVDEQLTDPYRQWVHQHRFRSVPEGVEVEDVVEYRLPFGMLGRVAHAAFVRRQLVKRQSVLRAAGFGAFFGLAAYAAFDLTGLALLLDFPLRAALVDLAWGSQLSAGVSAVIVAGTRVWSS